MELFIIQKKILIADQEYNDRIHHFPSQRHKDSNGYDLEPLSK